MTVIISIIAVLWLLVGAMWVSERRERKRKNRG